MGRKSKGAWWWAARQGWYCTIDNQRIPLCKGAEHQKEADRLWHLEMAKPRLKLERVTEYGSCLVVECLDDKLVSRKATIGEESHKKMKKTFQDWWNYLKKNHGNLKVNEVKPYHVSKWLDSTALGESSRTLAIKQIKSAFNHWVNGGQLEESPLRKLKTGKILSRSEAVYIDPKTRQLITDAIKDENFKVFWFALTETGCRPSEVAGVTADDFDPAQKLWRLNAHKTFKKTRKVKTVLLTDGMVQLCSTLALAHPTGSLFRNGKGRKWLPDSWGYRIRVLQQQLNLPNLIAYSGRHSFITDGLLHQSADVIGAITNQTPAVIRSNYSHLSSRLEELRAKLKEFRG